MDTAPPLQIQVRNNARISDAPIVAEGARVNMSPTWRIDNVLKLIDLYRNHEPLWNTSHRDYRNKKIKIDAWQDIAKTMVLPREEVESKVHTLRSQFIREKKKITSTSGNATWFAYNAMKFLLNSGSKDALETQNEENQDTGLWTANEEIEILDSPPTFQLESHFIQQSDTPPASTTSPDSQTSRKRQLTHEENLEDQYEVAYLRKSRIGMDEYDIYGQYVGSELRQVKDEYSVLMAKHYINKILLDARLGKYSCSDRQTAAKCRIKREPSYHHSPEHCQDPHEDLVSDMDSTNPY